MPRRDGAHGHPAGRHGYFAWSLLDNFEWQAGFEQRFGIVWVDLEGDLRRVVKDSARRYAAIAAGAELAYDDTLA